jgi:hypothetical protein
MCGSSGTDQQLPNGRSTAGESRLPFDMPGRALDRGLERLSHADRPGEPGSIGLSALEIGRQGIYET